ncbi:MAG: acyl-homoserine-lactone synthase [Paracoccaceae bacterium]
MQYSRMAVANEVALLSLPELIPAQESRPEVQRLPQKPPMLKAYTPDADPRLGHVRASVLSFLNMHVYGDLLVSFLRARKRTFIDRLNWSLPESDGMEFDQYDTPVARWIIIHEFGEVLGGIRMTPTTARCGIYTYMLRDAQKGLLEEIPTDVLFFEAPVSQSIWEASRLFISDDVPAHRRLHVQSVLMDALCDAAQEVGASQVIGIVPAVWSRWLRRLELDAVPVGPKFEIDGTISQAALFNTSRQRG